MTNARIFKVNGVEQTALPILARIYKAVPGTGRTPVVQADITSIALTVRRFNTVNGGWGGVTSTEAGLNVPVNPAIFNALQTDSCWAADLIGYNFAHTVPVAAFPGLGSYSLIYTFVPSSANFSILPLVIRTEILSLQGSLAEG